MDKEQAKRVRQFMRDSGIKHYIYGIGTLAGAKKAENLYFKTDEEFNQKAEKILSDKWNVEIYALHINDWKERSTQLQNLELSALFFCVAFFDLCCIEKQSVAFPDFVLQPFFQFVATNERSVAKKKSNVAIKKRALRLYHFVSPLPLPKVLKMA